MTDLTLQIESTDMSPRALQEMTRSLAHDISRQNGATAEEATTDAVVDTKGEPITLGVLLVTLMSSGTAVALLNVLKAYLERDRSVSFTIEQADGHKISLDAKSLEDAKSMAKQLTEASES